MERDERDERVERDERDERDERAKKAASITKTGFQVDYEEKLEQGARP